MEKINAINRENIASNEVPQMTRIAYMVLRKDREILLLKRATSGNFSLPAGHIEDGEIPVDGAIRETFEEVGVTIDSEDANLVHQFGLKEGPNANDSVEFYFFEAMKWVGEARVMEKDVHEEILWANVDNLPENINPNLRETLMTVYNPIKQE